MADISANNTMNDHNDIRADVTITAMKKAKSKLRAKNKGEWEVRLETMGNSGFTTSIVGHRILKGY